MDGHISVSVLGSDGQWREVDPSKLMIQPGTEVFLNFTAEASSETAYVIARHEPTIHDLFEDFKRRFDAGEAP